ncbi:hypothetical protein N0V93_003882 [Gnomoniopsis smithogilvyi]|uniref:Neutral protease 2 n=1 Tax=Gnomoniopsis smithogilvyi TaxID=1191159 RepID=A0A9W9D0G2_9PEZI|nr:hypothetical protein N0V93_003882 [Gnomoniopsis smithogilvyi]
MKMTLLWGMSMLVSVLAVSIPDNRRRDTPLEVTVESVENSALKASITNTGSEPLRLLKTGSILDSAAIERAEIFSGSEQLAFDGVRLAVSQQNLAEGAFQTLQAGQTVVTEWDPATVHDLSGGGEMDFVIRGSFLTAKANCTEVTGEIPFSANVVHSKVDGVTAAKVRRSFHESLRAKLKRSAVQNDCTGAKGRYVLKTSGSLNMLWDPPNFAQMPSIINISSLTFVKNRAQVTATQNCARMATAAEQAARNGSGDKLMEYFSSQSTSTRQTVAGVFNKIAAECDSTTSGVAEQYCSDVLQYCSDSILAYAVPSMDVMVSCGIYFEQLPGLETRCHRQDQATTTLHEVTHLRQVAGTNDFAYGYELATQLSTNQALKNADSYTLFANGKSSCLT